MCRVNMQGLYQGCTYPIFGLNIGFDIEENSRSGMGQWDNGTIHIGRFYFSPLVLSSIGIHLPALVVKKLVKLGLPQIFFNFFLFFNKLEKLLFCSDAFVMDVQFPFKIYKELIAIYFESLPTKLEKLLFCSQFHLLHYLIFCFTLDFETLLY